MVILSVTPESKNVSEGKMVKFYCATPDSGVFFSWSTMPNVGNTFVNDTDLPGGGKQSVLSFIATSQNKKTIVRCFATKDTTSVVNSALLLVQGKSTIGQSL